MSGITTGTALLVSAGIGLATAGAETGYQLSQSKPGLPDTAADEAKAANAAAQAQATALTKRRGMAATTLTSPLGSQTPAQTSKATLG